MLNKKKKQGILIITSISDIHQAETLAKKLLKKKLAACIQLIPKIVSLYHWKNSIQKDQESLLLIKSTEANFKKIDTFIKKEHPYELPEIISILINEGNQDYLNWLYQHCLIPEK
ncbi:MAG: divalent-cation tolerance protein CutA [bacterium]